MNNDIFYIDRDSFYATVDELNYQKKEPLVISMNYDKSIILSANYLAREKKQLLLACLYFLQRKNIGKLKFVIQI